MRAACCCAGTRARVWVGTNEDAGLLGTSSVSLGYKCSCLTGEAGRAICTVGVVEEEAMRAGSLGLFCVSMDNSLALFFCSDLGVLWYAPGRLALGLSKDAKSSNDSSFDSFVEGVIGEGIRSFSLTRNEYSGGADIARMRLIAGMKSEASVISLSCTANSSRVALRSSVCALGLSTLPVLSEVSLAVGSS